MSETTPTVKVDVVRKRLRMENEASCSSFPVSHSEAINRFAGQTKWDYPETADVYLESSGGFNESQQRFSHLEMTRHGSQHPQHDVTGSSTYCPSTSYQISEFRGCQPFPDAVKNGTSIPPIEPKLVLANNTVNNDQVQLAGVSQRPAADHDNDSYSDSASLDDEEEQDGSFITKQDFQEFIKEYRKDKAVTMGLLHQLVNLVEPLLCNSQSLLSPSFRCQEDSIPINTVSEIQDKVYCTVISDGETHELRLHPATIARLEAQKSKRGICNEVLMHLHPDVGYYNNLTVSGKSNRKSKDASDLRPLPLITKLFCIEVVNKLKPLDRSKFSSNDIYTEELKKYNVETVGQIGKSILDIRGKAGTGRRKNIQDATVLGEASSSPE